MRWARLGRWAGRLGLGLIVVMVAGGPLVLTGEAQGQVTESSGPRVALSSAMTAAFARSRDKHPKLVSQLATASRLAGQVRTAQVREATAPTGVQFVDDSVRVVIVRNDQDAARARASVAAVGGTVESQFETLTQALVPVSQLDALASDPGVQFVRLPMQGYPTAVTGQHVAASGANTWQQAGLNGEGMRIAIIDGGFEGYQNSINTGDLRPVGGTASFGCNNLEAGGDHGTNVAEIVQDMAPQATLWLYCVGGGVVPLGTGGGSATQNDIVINIGRAKDAAKAAGIQTIAMSLGFDHDNRGDGTGPAGTMGSITRDARQSGILWAASAGNSATSHWHGTFVDANNNAYHDFAANTDINTVTPNTNVPNGRSIQISLVWNEWPGSSQDYDLGLVDLDTLQFVATSAFQQSGTQPPREWILYTNNTGRTQRLAVVIFDDNKANGRPRTTPRMDLFIWPAFIDQNNFQFVTNAGSVLNPGIDANVMTVGAICWQNNRLEDYSSRGPTPDNRVKPDIAGQSVLTTSLNTFQACPANSFGTGGFNGTSAAAPVVAGAAALVRQAFPANTPAQIQAFLEGRAVDMGTMGKDTLYGAGRLALGIAPGSEPAVCAPRPPVRVTSVVGGDGRLAVTIAATGTNNTLQSIRFGTDRRNLTNAILDLPDGRTGLTTAVTMPLAPRTTTTTFWLRRQAGGQPTTVPLIVTDGCGAWETFVGGGAGARF